MMDEKQYKPSDDIPLPTDHAELIAFAKAWIDTAAQHLRNEEYLRKDRAELRKNFLDVLRAIFREADDLMSAETEYDAETLACIVKIFEIASKNIREQTYIKSRLEDEYPPNDKPVTVSLDAKERLISEHGLTEADFIMDVEHPDD